MSPWIFVPGGQPGDFSDCLGQGDLVVGTQTARQLLLNILNHSSVQGRPQGGGGIVSFVPFFLRFVPFILRFVPFFLSFLFLLVEFSTFFLEFWSFFFRYVPNS